MSGVIVGILTLRSYYFYGAGLSFDHAAIPIIVTMLALKRRPLTLSDDQLATLIMVAIAVCAAVAVTAFTIRPRRFDTAVAIAAYAFVTALWVTQQEPAKIVRAISTIALIHAGLLFVQCGSFYLGGHSIDFIQPVTGEESRNIGGGIDVLGLGFIYRASGAFIEPGTYSSYALCMAALMASYRDTDWTVLLVLLSVLLSFSAQGIIMGVGLATFYAGRYAFRVRLWRRFMVLLSFVGVALSIASIAVVQRFQEQGAGEHSLAIRLDAVAAALATWVGHGFIEPEHAISDATSFLYWYSVAGVFAAPLFALILFFCAARKASAVPLIVLMLSKIPPTAGFYWLVFFLAIVVSKKDVTGQLPGGVRSNAMAESVSSA